MLFQHKFTTLGISEVFSGGAQWWGNRAPIGEGEGEKGGGEEGGGEEGGRGGGWEGGRVGGGKGGGGRLVHVCRAETHFILYVPLLCSSLQLGSIPRLWKVTSMSTLDQERKRSPALWLLRVVPSLLAR